MVNIHYFYDPMCGWCYGATPLVAALVENKAVNLQFHPAGMLDSKLISREFRSHIIAADTNISTLTGVLFGQAYIQRIKTEKELILDSYLPIQAILAAQQQGITEYTILSALQQSHYQKGLPVNELATLVTLASQLGANENKFKNDIAENKQQALERISQSKAMMSKFAVQGFPTLLIETANGFERLAHNDFYDDVKLWENYINSYLEQ